jgi:hypothetical protein
MRGRLINAMVITADLDVDLIAAPVVVGRSRLHFQTGTG